MLTSPEVRTRILFMRTRKESFCAGLRLPLATHSKEYFSSYCFCEIPSYIGPAKLRQYILYIRYPPISEEVYQEYIFTHWLCADMYSHHAEMYLNLQGRVMDFRSVELRLIIVFIIFNLKIPQRIQAVYYILYIIILKHLS